MPIIKKIKLLNFKKYKTYTIYPNDSINIFIGDNEVGKSTILEAIDLVASGSMHKAESIGVDHLMNIQAVSDFLADSKKSFNTLPQITIELYLTGCTDANLQGENNTDESYEYGIRFEYKPNEDYRNEVEDFISNNDDIFPFDYYFPKFSTFSDQTYYTYNRKIQSIYVDSTQFLNNNFASSFTTQIYKTKIKENIEFQIKHKRELRKIMNDFDNSVMEEFNSKFSENPETKIKLNKHSINNIEKQLMVYENDISLENIGSGKQTIIKTYYALSKNPKDYDCILVEEPETHLTHTNLRKLISKIKDNQKCQIFLTTHNSLVCSRLELNNIFVVNEYTKEPLSLNKLERDTAKYFIKCPPASIVEFVLSKKTILVEGPSEYLLIEKFYKESTGNSLEKDNIAVLAIRGLSFKRYLDIATLTNNKVAVIRDNDKNFEKNCVSNYSEYNSYSNIKIFSDKNDSTYTFEVALYNVNNKLCETIYPTDTLNKMIKNKTETAYSLLCKHEHINVPEYIEEAFRWIKN